MEDNMWATDVSEPAGKPRRKSKTTGGTSRRAVRLNLVVAVMLAGFVGVLMFGLAGGDSSDTGIWVLRTSDDLAAGTALSPEDFDAVQVRRSEVDGKVPDPIPAKLDEIVEETKASGVVISANRDALERWADDYLVDVVARWPMLANQQLGSDVLAAQAVGSDPIGPNERLVSVEASVANAVAGTIRVGDHVSVVAVSEVASDGVPLAGVVLEDVEVTAIQLPSSELESVQSTQADSSGDLTDSRPSQLLPSQPLPGIYTLRVKAADVTRLAAVVGSQTPVVLVWRPANARPAQTEPASVTDALCATAVDIETCKSTIVPTDEVTIEP